MGLVEEEEDGEAAAAASRASLDSSDQDGEDHAAADVSEDFLLRIAAERSHGQDSNTVTTTTGTDSSVSEKDQKQSPHDGSTSTSTRRKRTPTTAVSSPRSPARSPARVAALADARSRSRNRNRNRQLSPASHSTISNTLGSPASDIASASANSTVASSAAGEADPVFDESIDPILLQKIVNRQEHGLNEGGATSPVQEEGNEGETVPKRAGPTSITSPQLQPTEQPQNTTDSGPMLSSAERQQHFPTQPQRQRESLNPGAYSVQPGRRQRRDLAHADSAVTGGSSFLFRDEPVSENENNNDEVSAFLVEANLVEDQPEVDQERLAQEAWERVIHDMVDAEAEVILEEDPKVLLQRRRKKQCLFLSVVLLLVGLIIGLTVGLQPKSTQIFLTGSPTFSPTMQPTTSAQPTKLPSISPSTLPTVLPSESPTNIPSLVPTTSSNPSLVPTPSPSRLPSWRPSALPTKVPSEVPSISPQPSLLPTGVPTNVPSSVPTNAPDNNFCDQALVLAAGETARIENLYAIPASFPVTPAWTNVPTYGETTNPYDTTGPTVNTKTTTTAAGTATSSINTTKITILRDGDDEKDSNIFSMESSSRQASGGIGEDGSVYHFWVDCFVGFAVSGYVPYRID